MRIKMENIQAKMKELFGNSCYAYCLAYKFIGDKSIRIKYLTSCVLHGWYSGYIDDDGYVSDPVNYVNKTCKTYCNKIDFPKIKDVQKLVYKKENLTEDVNIVMFEYNKGTHFVCMNKEGDVIFDPSGDSNSVKYGVPTSIRKYIYAV